MAATTDLEYNDVSREIQMRYDIYFKRGQTPLSVTKDNYLISSTGLEESQSDTDTALGAVSSNEITFELLNEDRIFDPTNPDGPYYGRIKKDVQVDVFGRAAQDDPDAEWDSLGTYYVKDWYTDTANLVASVTANDKLYDVLNAPKPTYKVAKNVSIRSLFRDYFNLFGVSSTIEASISGTLPVAYIESENREFITALTNGALALCFGNRRGGVTILDRLASRSLRATLTDDDQLVSINTKQSINVGYTGSSVVCNAPYEGAPLELVTLRDQSIPVGTSVIDALDLSSYPMVRLTHAKTSNSSVIISKITATPRQCAITVVNTLDHEVEVDISVFGTVVENSSSTLAGTGTNLLDLNSPYVQTLQQAEACKAYLDKFVGTTVPTLSVSVRGNFKLQIGDKIRVQSTKYKTDFTGVIIRNEYKYDGGLSGTLTLMDASLFGG